SRRARRCDPMGLFDTLGSGLKKLNPLSWGDESESAKQQRAALEDQAGKAGGFADQAQGSFGQLGAEAAGAREALRRQASGEESVSREMLRQALQQQVAAQRSAAAGAAPANAAMAARTAAIQS